MEEELGGDKPVRARALLVASRPDEASMNIARALMASYGFEPTGLEFEGSPIYSSGDVALIFIDVETIHAEHVDKALEGLEAVIFVSKHSSRSGIACLSTHTPGNLGPEADYGGKPMELAWSDPNRLRVALRALVEAREELGLSEYMPCLEATHHGPTGLGLPVLFVEIGSTPDRWADEVAAEAVARAAWEAARASPGHGIKKAVGFGGGHYAPKFSKLVLEEAGVAVGHIVPKYAFKAYGASRWLVEGPVEKTWGGCDLVVVDKKGMRGSDRRFVVSVAEELGLEVLII